jgi:Cu/Ag efflux pump CusA
MLVSAQGHPGALLGIFLLLFVDFGESRPAALVFVTLPFALVGGVLAAVLSGGVLSLGSLVGFVSVLGIAARNGIFSGKAAGHEIEHPMAVVILGGLATSTLLNLLLLPALYAKYGRPVRISPST